MSEQILGWQSSVGCSNALELFTIRGITPKWQPSNITINWEQLQLLA
jgi:hypothetical protein